MSTKHSPLISVYMPTHNRLNLLPRAVDSVLKQNYHNLELIIVDDGSTDATREYLEALKKTDERIRTFHLAESKGPSHARNLAIKEARGEFITGIDDDDEFLPDRLSIFLDAWDKDYAFITSSFFWDYGKKRKLVSEKTHAVSLEDLLSHKHAICQVFTHTQNLIDAGLFDETMRNSEDWDLWIRLALSQKAIKKLEAATYIIHTAHDLPRLSLDARKAEGIQRLIDNYQHHMSPKNKKDMAIWLAIMEQRIIPLAQLLPLLTRDNLRIYAKFWLSAKLPMLNQLLRKMTKRTS